MVTVVGDVEFLPRFLVLGSERPPVDESVADRITFKSVADSGAHLSGLEIRRAVELSDADHVAIVRSSRGVDPNWVLEAARRLRQPRVASVTFVTGPTAVERTVLFSTGAITVISLPALREIGGFWWAFDDGCLEQDAQWRLSARGYDVVSVPGLVAGTFEGGLGMDSRLLLMANNLEQENVERILPSLVVAVVTAPFREYGVATRALDLQVSPGGDDLGTITVPSRALKGVTAVNSFAALLGRVRDSRPITQETRRLSDRMLGGRLQEFVDSTWDSIGGDRALYERVFPARPPTRTAVLIAGADDPRDGEGISSWITVVARRLSVDFDVRYLAIRANRVLVFREVWEETDESGAELANWPDAVVFEGVYLRSVPWIASSGVPIVVDCTRWAFEDDLAAEFSGLTASGDDHGVHAHLLNETMSRADFVLVADGDHRDRMLGLMAGLKRLNALVYDEDQSLHNLVEVLDDDTLTQLVSWCRMPRKAVDLVRSFGRCAPEQSRGSKVGSAIRSVGVGRRKGN